MQPKTGEGTPCPDPNRAVAKPKLRRALSEHYPLLSVMVAYMLVAVSLGPYSNADTAWELDAVSGVLKYGMPYAGGAYLMDQPPVGFYIQAGLFSVSGISASNGTFLVTLFGLGCIPLVYYIGASLYGRTTGFFASLLFALSPWHLILSRSFLIDTQCLFFSLLCLTLALIALRRNSFGLFAASGIVFAAAFNTKLYAVFILLPLLALFFRYHPQNPKRALTWLGAFAAPVLVSSYLWYDAVAHIGMKSIVLHMDFMVQSAGNVVASPLFVTNFLANYGLGWFFIDAALFSLALSVVGRRLLRRFLSFDVVCVAVIVLVMGVNIALGVGLNLKAPYLNAIKYEYQALPFFSFISAALVTKSLMLLAVGKERSRRLKAASIAAAAAGLVLVSASILYNMRFVNLFSRATFLIFRVEPSVDYGYSLFNAAPIGANSALMAVQYIGFAVALSGVAWFGRGKLKKLLNPRLKS